jgi:repressor of nif and glnA expression
MIESKIISTIYMVNDISATLVLPLVVVKKKGLDNPKHVIAEEIEQGILIRRIGNDSLDGFEGGKYASQY